MTGRNEPEREQDAQQALGALLRQYRKRGGLTQEELAERAGSGLSVYTISNAERGRTRPSRYTLKEVMAALELNDVERRELHSLWREAGIPPTSLDRSTLSAPVAGGPIEAGDRKEPPASPTRLPTPPTRLIGRAAEVQRVLTLVKDARLVTITGLGGVGKTRLAIQAATEVRHAFAAGTVFLELAAVEDPALVIPLIGQAVGLREGSGSIDALTAFLRDKHLLLVLDNFEHVLPAGIWLGQLLRAAPRLHILVTSRVPLRLYGEQEFRVPSLAVAGGKGEEASGEAVQLFVERARGVRPDLVLQSDTLPVVAAICAHLDGLPLAIELAAARCKHLSPQAILARLEGTGDRTGSFLNMLVGGPRDLPERQQTLRNTINWSHDLLDEEGQRIFRWLAVFSGFEVASAGVVCELGDDALDRLATLDDQGLLEWVDGAADTLRFRMLQPVREYALERLVESGKAEDVRRRHAQHYLTLAEHMEPQLVGPEQARAARRLELEIENLRGALRSLLEFDPVEAARLATLLDRFWTRHGYVSEGRWWLEEALARFRDPRPIRGRALVACGCITVATGDFVRATAQLEEALAIFRAVDEQAGVASALAGMGEVHLLQTEYERSRDCREEALRLFRELGDVWGSANALSGIGGAAALQLDLESAIPALEESAKLFEEVGDRWARANTLNFLARAMVNRRAPSAHRVATDALRAIREFDDAGLGWRALAVFAQSAGFERQNELAATLWGAVKSVIERSGYTMHAPHREPMETQLRELRAALGETAFEAAFASGHRLAPDQAIELALAAEAETATSAIP
jgi:predicted ATPase/transcriptional regulator with XRE-family HTH domain